MDENTTLLKERKPVRQEKKPKAIELKYEEPISFKVLSARQDLFKKEGNAQVLAFNDQGILLLTNDFLEEGSFINLSIKFKGLGHLDGILGKVKKVEESEEHDFYVGVELYSPEKIKVEALSGLFPERTESFKAKLRKSLINYLKLTKRTG